MELGSIVQSLEVDLKERDKETRALSKIKE